MYRTTTLPNGLRLVTSVMPQTRSVAINIFVGTGSRYEKTEEAGMSHFIEHVCFRGTKKRPTAAEICGAIEGTGGILNAGTDKELTTYYCKVADPFWASSLDVMTDIITNPTFPEPEIEKERQIIIEEINMTLDTPSQRVGMLLDEIMWPDHPLGRDIAGYRKTVSSMSREKLLTHLHHEYQPSNTVIAIAGNIDEGEVAAELDRLLGNWQPGPYRRGFEPYRKTSGRVVKIERRKTEQTQLCLALPALSVLDPDRFKIGILNAILGEGMSSRLFTHIRDELGLAYSIHSYPEYFLDTGALTISAGVENGTLKKAVTAILKELASLKEDIPEEELERAKQLFNGRTLLRLEDSHAVAGWMGAQSILHQRVYNVEEVLAMVNETTVEDLLRIARRLFMSDELRLAVVGPVDPREPLEDLLEL